MDHVAAQLKLYQEFVDEMQRQGKLTNKDVEDFFRRKEAVKIVDDMFKGMF